MKLINWIKSLIFLLLSLPFLIIGATALSLALLGGLIGTIGVMLLAWAGLARIPPSFKQAFQEEWKKYK